MVRVGGYGCGAGGAPGAVRGGGVSKSVAKAPRAGIGGEKKRGISTIPYAHPGGIRAFATDLDKRRRRGPLRGRRPRRSPRSRGRASPPRAPRRALRTRKCSSNRVVSGGGCTITGSEEWSMHLSRAECTSRRAQDRPASHYLGRPRPHRPAPVPVRGPRLPARKAHCAPLVPRGRGAGPRARPAHPGRRSRPEGARGGGSKPRASHLFRHRTSHHRSARARGSRKRRRSAQRGGE